MSGFDDNNKLVETGDVPLIVEISGGDQVWRYTNSDGPITDEGGHQHEPVPLTISNVRADGAMGGDQIDLRLPRGVPIADQFFPVATRTVYRVVIRQVSHENGVVVGGPHMFKGVIIAAAITGDDGEQIRLKLSTQMGLLERSGLRRRYQLQCPHVLYGAECRASKSFASFPANIEPHPSPNQAVGDVHITIHGEIPDEPWMWRGRDLRQSFNREFLNGSTISFAGGNYEIVSQTLLFKDYPAPTTIWVRVLPHQAAALRAALLAAAPNDRVCGIVPNCDHTVACCNDVFSNGVNYGGMPWIPLKNPIHDQFLKG